jgi:hypothetical protein
MAGKGKSIILWDEFVVTCHGKRLKFTGLFKPPEARRIGQPKG